MNVFIVGSNIDPNKLDDFKSISKKIGCILGNSQHKIILCSAHESSVDYYILQGIALSEKSIDNHKIIVYRPDDENIRNQWRKLRIDLCLGEIQFHSQKEVNIIDPSSRSLAFLFCQIKALEISDVVLLIGGSLTGSANFISAIAMQKNIPIIPIRFFSGVGNEIFNRVEGDLKTRYENNLIEKLSDIYEIENILLPLIDGVKGVKNKSDIRVFLSYSWRRSDLADLVEAILRRRSIITVFRDEKDIKQAEVINSIIEEEIKEKCHIFIALWCKDYIESPYCYDELMMWLKYRKKGDLYLLRFDKTRPVWPELRLEKNNRLEFNALWPELGEERGKIELALNKIIDTIKSTS